MQSFANDLLKLQNGNDIRGVSLDGIEGETVNFTDDIARKISCAFVGFLTKKTNMPLNHIKIGIGYDSRLSANWIKNGVICGIVQGGAIPLDCGLASTPAMFMGTIFNESNFDGAIMITASHLPFNRNGMKFFTKNGGLEKADITELLTSATKTEAYALTKPACQTLDLISLYSNFLCEKIKLGVNAKNYNLPLSGLKIVLNASNGSGGFFEDMVLKKLGADTTGSLNLGPDGTFPNHVPNPENSAAMEALQSAVLSAKADLGVIFDTDVDRAAVVLSDGSEINRNKIIGLMAAIVAKTDPHTTIVTDSVTSDELTGFIENKLKMTHHRFKRGYKNVINEAIRLNNENTKCCLAIETSGHCALKENYFLDDGAYMSVKIIIEAALCKQSGKPLSGLIRGLSEADDAKEFRLKINCDNFAVYGNSVLSGLKSFAAKNNFTIAPNSYEGLRLSFAINGVNGWMLLRLSLHDPLLVLNIESNSPGGVKEVCKTIMPFFEQFDQVCISQIADYIKYSESSFNRSL